MVQRNDMHKVRAKAGFGFAACCFASSLLATAWQSPLSRTLVLLSDARIDDCVCSIEAGDVDCRHNKQFRKASN
jgi:hypothetical protein